MPIDELSRWFRAMGQTLRRIRRRLLASIAGVLLAAPAGHASPPVEAEASPSAGSLYSELLDDSKGIAEPQGFSVALELVDGRVVRWSLEAEASAVLSHFGDSGLPTGDELPAALLRWSRAVSAELLQLTRARVAGDAFRYFNPDVDFEASVSICVLPLSEYETQTFHVAFTGDRLTYVYIPGASAIFWRMKLDPDSQSSAASIKVTDAILREQAGKRARQVAAKFPVTDPPLEVDHTQVFYTVELDRSTWRIGELITGTTKLTNTGTRRVHIDSTWGARNVVLLNDDRSSSPDQLSSIGVYTLPRQTQFTFLMPGESATGRFQIATDTNLPNFSGYAVLPGVYYISFGKITNVLVKGEPQAIQITD